MDLSIIIVNWHSANYVEKCLTSIIANAHTLKYEIIVVDNASYDGCDKLIENSFPEVRFIQAKKNDGFAKANNLGFQNSSGNNVLFLNPDTEIIGDAIRGMLTVIVTAPQTGLVGCKLLNTDMTLQTSCIQPFPTILNQILDSDLLHSRFPKLSLWGPTPHLQDKSGVTEVQVVSGACILIKRSVFEEIGGFSSDYFMYTEDMGLSGSPKALSLCF